MSGAHTLIAEALGIHPSDMAIGPHGAMMLTSHAVDRLAEILDRKAPHSPPEAPVRPKIEDDIDRVLDRFHIASWLVTEGPVQAGSARTFAAPRRELVSDLAGIVRLVARQAAETAAETLAEFLTDDR